MAPRKKATAPDPNAGRYPQRVLAAEIETAREKLGIPVKAAADDIGVGRKVWYKKRDNDGSSFLLEDVSRLADEWDAPDYWPFRSCRNQSEWDGWKARYKAKKGPTP